MWKILHKNKILLTTRNPKKKKRIKKPRGELSLFPRAVSSPLYFVRLHACKVKNHECDIVIIITVVVIVFL